MVKLDNETIQNASLFSRGSRVAFVVLKSIFFVRSPSPGL